MKFVPVIGKMLADFAMKGATDNSQLIEPWNISRGVLVKAGGTAIIMAQQSVKRISLQRAALFKKWVVPPYCQTVKRAKQIQLRN